MAHRTNQVTHGRMWASRRTNQRTIGRLVVVVPSVFRYWVPALVAGPVPGFVGASRDALDRDQVAVYVGEIRPRPNMAEAFVGEIRPLPEPRTTILVGEIQPDGTRREFLVGRASPSDARKESFVGKNA